MNTAVRQFPYVIRDSAFGSASLAPMMPIKLAGTSSAAFTALLDTGAAINVIPYSAGLQLGFVWEQQTTTVKLTGNLASAEARVILVNSTVADFPTCRLAFAWAKQDGIPIILGQVNFFMEFDVCFFRARSCFEVRPKT